MLSPIPFARQELSHVTIPKIDKFSCAPQLFRLRNIPFKNSFLRSYFLNALLMSIWHAINSAFTSSSYFLFVQKYYVSNCVKAKRGNFWKCKYHNTNKD